MTILDFIALLSISPFKEGIKYALAFFNEICIAYLLSLLYYLR